MKLKQINVIKQDASDVLDGNIERLKEFKNKSIFISGASGFVGKWVVELFNHLNQNHNFNVQLTCYSRSIKEQANIHPEIYNKPHIKCISGDIKSLSQIDSDISYVLHLAATPDNRDHSSDPVKVMNDIISGTNKILDASTRLDKLINFTFFSSGQVNGPQPMNVTEVREDTYHPLNCSSLNSVYSESKRAAETLTHSYRSLYKVPLTILRPFAFIGPYQSIDRPWAINNFIRDSLHGQPIRILGDEETVRSYMYPSEMAYWTLLALLNPGSGSVFNLGSNDGKNLRAISQIVERSFDNRIGVISTVPSHSGLLTRFVPSTEKFETTFKVKRQISTQDAIERSAKWYKLGL